MPPCLGVALRVDSITRVPLPYPNDDCNVLGRPDTFMPFQEFAGFFGAAHMWFCWAALEIKAPIHAPIPPVTIAVMSTQSKKLLRIVWSFITVSYVSAGCDLYGTASDTGP